MSDISRSKHFILFKYLTPILVATALTVIYLISRHNYKLFHSLADGVSIVIASCAFTIIWNSRRSVDNNYFLYAGISFLFFAILDLMHLLGNKGMGVFPEFGNLGPEFYIASRYVLSTSLITAPLFINRKLNTTLMFTAYSLGTLLILLSILYWRTFPVCLVEGVGLTPFKVISDYIICLILLGAIGLLLVNRRSFDGRVLRIIVSSLILSIATGLTFTLYTDPFGVTNMFGHLFQIASFYLIYLAFIETILTKPQEILFRKLTQHKETLTQNVQQLDKANAELNLEMAERRRAETELRESEAKYRNLFENITEGVHFWQLVSDDDGNIRTWRLVDANPPALKSWGKVTLDEIRGKGPDEIFGPGATERYLPVVRKIMSEGIPHCYEDYFPQLDTYLQCTSVPFGDYFITTDTDITAIRKTSEELRLALAKAEEGDRLLSALMEHAPEGIAMFDAELNVIRISRYGQEMLGPALIDRLMPDGIVPKAVFHADGETPMAFADLPLVRAVQGGEIVKDTEIVHLNSQGVQLPLLYNAGPIRDGVGRVIGGIVSWRDISDHKRAEEALRRSNQELQQFAYVASHDLQEPLRAIIGFLQLLQVRYGDKVDQKGRHYIDRTVKAGHRMQEMIRDLLNLSRVSNTESKFVPVDLNHVLRNVLDGLQRIILEKNADVVCGDLPDIEADPGQMQSLFQNLILNGLRYNQSPRPVIEVGSSVQDNFYRILIRDNGIGIAPKFHQRIFMVFQRLHTNGEYSGTGMGLAVCRKIVERHGGTIWVESEPDKGAVFCFTLPRNR